MRHVNYLNKCEIVSRLLENNVFIQKLQVAGITTIITNTNIDNNALLSIPTLVTCISGLFFPQLFH